MFGWIVNYIYGDSGGGYLATVTIIACQVELFLDRVLRQIVRLKLG